MDSKPYLSEAHVKSEIKATKFIKDNKLDEDDEFFRSSATVTFTATPTASASASKLPRIECLRNQDSPASNFRSTGSIQDQLISFGGQDTAESNGNGHFGPGELIKTKPPSKNLVQIQNERNAHHPKAIKCEFCGNIYRGKLVLRRHHIVIHRLQLPNWKQVLESENRNNAKITCHVCGKLVARRSLNLHIKSTVHQSSVNAAAKSIGSQKKFDRGNRKDAGSPPEEMSPIARELSLKTWKKSKRIRTAFDTAGWKRSLPTETCNLCGGKFRHKYTLRVHHAKVHKLEVPRIYSRRPKASSTKTETQFEQPATKIIPAAQPLVLKPQPNEQEKRPTVTSVIVGMVAATDWTARVRCLLCPKICGRLHIFDHLRNVHNKPGARRFYELVSSEGIETGQHQCTAQPKPASNLQDTTSHIKTGSVNIKRKVKSSSPMKQQLDQTRKEMNEQVEHPVQDVQCIFCEEVMLKARIGLHLVEQHSDSLGLERYYKETTDKKTVPVPSGVGITKKDLASCRRKHGRKRGRGQWLRLMSEKTKAEAELSRACIEMLTRKVVVKVQRLEEILKL